MIGQLHDIPGEHSIECRIPAVAGGSVDKVAVGVAPFKCVVTKVEVLHDAAVTGAATNNFKGALINGGAAGAGTTEIAGKTYDNGVDGAAFNDTLTLNTTVANLNLAEGERILYEKTENGTGLADPAKLVRVTFKGR